MPEQPRRGKSFRRMPIPVLFRSCAGCLVCLLFAVPLGICVFAAFVVSLPFMLFDTGRQRP